MKRETYSSIIRQAVLNIPKELVTMEFLEDFADIWYYNKRMNNGLKQVAMFPTYKRHDKEHGTDHLKKPRMYAKGIQEICKKRNIIVTFFKPIKIRSHYAKYSLNGKDLTYLINL